MDAPSLPPMEVFSIWVRLSLRSRWIRKGEGDEIECYKWIDKMTKNPPKTVAQARIEYVVLPAGEHPILNREHRTPSL